jgi:hypothetical protein
MKRASVAVKPCASDSKLVLRDLFIIATVFVALSAFCSTVLAILTVSFAMVWDNQGASIYRSVRGNQTTAPFAVVNGTSEHVALLQVDGDWIQTGICKGWSPNGTDKYEDIWVPVPYYYVERDIEGLRYYNCTLLEPAPIGLLQNHQYRVFMYTDAQGVTTACAWIDGVPKTSDRGFSSASNRAFGATETHDTQDQMNSHFFDVRGGTTWLDYTPFQNDYTHVDNHPPYTLNNISDTEWTATG